MSSRENKSNDGFSSGITLIIIGVVALMAIFFDFEIDWKMIAKLWPLMLIIIGVCMLPINKWIKTILTVALLIFGLLAYQNKVGGCCKRTDNCIEKIEDDMTKSSFFEEF